MVTFRCFLSCCLRNENISCVALIFFLIYSYASSLVFWDAAVDEMKLRGMAVVFQASNCCRRRRCEDNNNNSKNNGIDNSFSPITIPIPIPAPVRS